MGSPFAARTEQGSVAGWAGIVRTLSLVAAVSASLLPPSVLVRGPQLCAFKHVYGVDCPTCGLTRATVAAGHLSLKESVRFHPLGIAVLLALWVAAAGLLPVNRWLQGGLSAAERRGAEMLAIALVCFGVVRAVRRSRPAKSRP